MNGRQPRERLQKLERTDKWFLSCGDGIIWAPPFPTALQHPGFWDEALVYYYPFAPLFSVAVVMPDGNELPLQRRGFRWEPHTLTVEWSAGDSIFLQEQRFAYPGGQFVSLWSCNGREGWKSQHLEGAHLVCFSAQPGDTAGPYGRSTEGTSLYWRRTLQDRHGENLDVEATLSVVGDVDDSEARCASVRSEGTAPLPRWDHTPFWEKWCQQEEPGLTDQILLEGVTEDGLVYAALDVPLRAVTGTTVGFSITLRPTDLETDIAPSGSATTDADPSQPWLAHFELYPAFVCSDEHLTRYYDYRLYGLRLNSLAGGFGNVRYPAIAEGIGYFHVPITYSAQCHMWETRWSSDPAVAHGSLLNFLEHQRENGSFHGRIYSNHMNHTDFYHANWGDAVLAVDSVHRDEAFIARSYDGLARYAEWLDTTRDSEQSGMYDVANHFETGQEYMSRYQTVNPDADRAGWQEGILLKGIDITTYAYRLKRCLGKLASRLGHEDKAKEWSVGADRIGSAILDIMWDEETGMFSDVDPRTGSRTKVKAAVCFYPLLTNLLTDDMVRSLLDHLSDPTEFATPFPVPSSSIDDPLFNADAEWKGKRHNCPWNGRTWPMTNSHIIEGLIRQWQRGRREVGALASDLLTRFVKMMFFDGDLSRPNCFEHYNPLTGHPSAYRGIDDYQHSWVLDLLIRGVAGLEPRSDCILIDPLPLNVTHARLVGAIIRGRRVSVVRQGQQIDVTVDDTSYNSEVGAQLRIPDA